MDHNRSENPLAPYAGMRIGELLVKEGFLKESEIDRALAIQKEEKGLSALPLGQIFVKKGYLSEEDLNELLENPELKRTVGLLAVEKGMISEEQLESALQRKPPDRLIGEFLVSEGLLGKEDLLELLREQINAPRLGELAVKLNLISQRDLENALKIQKSPRVLGEVLCDLKLINPLDLYFVLNKYKKQFKLGEILQKLGFIDKETLNKSLQEQKHSSDSLGQILVRKKLITTDQLQEALSKQTNIPFRSLKEFAYSETDKRALSGIVSQKYAEKNMMIPISLAGKELTVGIINPDKIHTARELKALYNNLNISCMLISEEKFSELFEVLYSKRLPGLKSAVEGAGEEETDAPAMDFMQMELDEEMDGEKETPVYDAQDIEAEEIVNFIIKYGIGNSASDIHLEQDREGVKLRYRIDGVLTDVNIKWLRRKLQEKAGSIVSRIKIISNLDIAERRLPQDGVFRINYYDKAKNQKTDLDFRVATCRGIVGENIVIRILDSRKANVGLENLNHSPHVLDPFQRLLKSSAGMILVTGPTGSGKSSTLYGALRYIYNPAIKIITAEDPIEYNFPGVMQTQVNHKIDLGFARLMRSFLRLDPDVILVGEIRDRETAKIGFDAAQTGHLVLSTLHTNDSVSSVSRLLDLEVERSQAAACLTCALAQRLVRRICPSCSREYMPEEDEWFLVFPEFPSHLKFYKGKGCDACNFTGFKGRTLLSEVFVVDKEISKALSSGVDVDELKVLAIERGMKTMLDDGLLKLRETTLSEVIRVIPHEMMQAFRTRQKTRASQAESEFLLADPSRDTQVIRRMHEKFTAMASRVDPEGRVEPSLFGEFITKSFLEICNEYRCTQVKFKLQEGNRKVDISAVPL